MQIDPRLLRHAVALAKHGTFSRAARVLGLTQPALSKSIRSLEDLTGCTLFDRDARDLCPTAAGRALLLEAERLLDRLDDLPHELAALRDEPAGRLVIGLGQFGVSEDVAAGIAALADRHPGIEVELVFGGWWNLESLLRGREIDVYVGESLGVEPDATLDARLLWKDASRWVVRAEHPLAKRETVTTREIFEWPIAVPPLTRPIAGWLVRSRAEAREAGGLLVCHNQDFLQRVLETSDAVGAACDRTTAEAVARGALTAIGSPKAHQPVRVFAITLRDRPLATLARRFVESLPASPERASEPPPRGPIPPWAFGTDEPDPFIPYDRFLTPRLEWSPVLRMPTRRVDSRALEYVAALAREGSFSRAARVVDLTQSGLSKAIGSLEERIGTPLFVRSATGATPTPACDEMLRRLGPLLERLDVLPGRIAALATRRESRVSVGLGAHATADWVADAVGAVLGAHPEIEMQIVSGNWFEMEPALRAGELDLFIGYPAWAARERHAFEVRMLLQEHHVCWVREGHPLVGRGALTMQDISAHPVAVPFFARMEDGGVQGTDLFRSGMIVCNHVSMLRRIALQGDAVIGASASALRDTRGLVPLAVTTPTVDTSLGLVSLRGRPLPSGGIALVEELGRRTSARHEV